ncbi:hypothetical protein NS263_02705 [Curtobacterium oceanosedimentum]|uniref:Uncharacterized protein n=1 Tax=Curtobacterium oceanosedimentum TaxID=465820 RepID=A0ABR5S9Z6_9MICO|nr:hypothetical protein [Curtobacterium oceanosedimentum]KTR42106.1 hypothetical protein NS263_02705 [Curtobacterium oceanosedimentum]
MAKVRGNDPTGYSYGDADALKTAARNLASAIDGQTATRSAAVTNAEREFRGYFSQVFADNAGIASRSASKLSDALSSLVGFVDELREAAKQEDRRRADAKAWEAWKREREENFFVGAAVAAQFEAAGGGSGPATREHARANPDAIYEYRVIDRGTPGQHLDRLEEYHIRRLGGPTNKGNPDGLLENKRHQMREARYQAAGGDPY